MHKTECFTLNIFPLRPATNAMLIQDLSQKQIFSYKYTLMCHILLFKHVPRFKSAYSIMFPFCFSLLCVWCLLTVQKCVVVISNTFYKCNLNLLIFSRFFSLVARWVLIHEIFVTPCPFMHRYICNSITPIVSQVGFSSLFSGFIQLYLY